MLIVVVGLLNFHPPHFLFQSGRSSGDTSSYVLEAVLLANLLAALVAALGIYRDLRWAWLAGIAVAGISALLYVAQETVGLPGLPKDWAEPSRIVALAIEALFVVVATVPAGRRASNQQT